MTFAEKIERKLLPVATKLSTNKYLMSMRDGILLAMPLIIVGSAFMIIASFPIQAFTDFLTNVGATDYLWKAVNSSFGLVALIASFGIANSMAHQFGVDGTPAGIISISSFITVTPFISAEEIGSGIPIGWMGSKGLFVAIILGLLVGKIYAWFINKNIVIKMPDSVPPAVSRSFTALIPAAAIISGSIILAAGVDALGFGNIHEVIAVILGKPLGVFGGNLFGTLVMVGLNSIFWFMGIHGGTMVGSVMNPIWLMLTDENRLAFQAGQELPNIITTPFLDLFVWIGGGGATIGLAIAIAIIARRKNSSQLTKALAPVTSTPALFNINEPLMFGIPIVMNVRMLVPFIITPMMNAVISYIAMGSGIVAKTTGANVPWTMPPVISGFLATNDWKASVLQVLLIVMDTAVYYVFFRGIEHSFKEMEQEVD
ncbi:PTS sugar transporter subunit IIC [Allofustis seminis]|uniref:PTS sugar transporter subunit IIC n=1 Tax=Allofustis seminis TaxID=166939 RepID=UPI00036F3BB1|nr:PTS sugar transporter subunit IIC [Allofustis seminis]